MMRSWKAGKNWFIPPNILCIRDRNAKVPHDILPCHHVHAPLFPTRFRFRIISMFNYIICMAMLLSEIFESVLMISTEVTRCWIKEMLIKAVEVFRETAIGDFDIAEILLDNQAGTCQFNSIIELNWVDLSWNKLLFMLMWFIMALSVVSKLIAHQWLFNIR